MYCTPLGLAYARRPWELVELAPALSALTHHDERCRTAVLAVTLAAAALARGEDRRSSAEAGLEAVLERDGGEELEFLVEHVGRSRAIDGPDQGFCLFTAGAAFQALLRFDAFEPALMHVVGLGGDTDTNGAVAGALLGASVGAGGLPYEWLERLRDADGILADAEALVPLAVLTD
jgi:ADP-ribosylglycohydrolase